MVEFSQEKLADVSGGMRRGEIIAGAVCTARNLVSEPPDLLFPVELAGRARRMAEAVGLKSTVLGEAAMRELGMNILLAVSRRQRQMKPSFLFSNTRPQATKTSSP